jgi:hypothetical protein
MSKSHILFSSIDLRDSKFDRISAFDSIMQLEAEKKARKVIAMTQLRQKQLAQLRANIDTIMIAMRSQGYRKNLYLEFAMKAVDNFKKSGLAIDHVRALHLIEDAAKPAHWHF